MGSTLNSEKDPYCICVIRCGSVIKFARWKTQEKTSPLPPPQKKDFWFDSFSLRLSRLCALFHPMNTKRHCTSFTTSSRDPILWASTVYSLFFLFFFLLQVQALSWDSDQVDCSLFQFFETIIGVKNSLSLVSRFILDAHTSIRNSASPCTIGGGSVFHLEDSPNQPTIHTQTHTWTPTHTRQGSVTHNGILDCVSLCVLCVCPLDDNRGAGRLGTRKEWIGYPMIRNENEQEHFWETWTSLD